MSQKYDDLKELLKQLFQLDRPELDFGLYRIMHAKSAEVTKFLDEDLLPQVEQAFEIYKSADRAELQSELEKAIEKAEDLGVDPETTDKVKTLRSRLENEAVDIDRLESEVFDHLYRFFRRYYLEGDFLSKRVYKEGVYAIPYEGEEVKLHWANADQYYTKTGEYLRNYAFRLRPHDTKNPLRVRFGLIDAEEGEHGNIKDSSDRVFVLAPDREDGPGFMAVEQDSEGKALIVRFEYRPATMEDWPPEKRNEERERLKNPKPPKQSDLDAIATERILGSSDDIFSEWVSELAGPHVLSDGSEADYTRLEAHLRRYNAKNTFDYFIHKDLGGFLRRELDFYIKNEVMHLDDIENESAPRVEQYLSKIKVIRRIAGKLIDFLAQLEDFQKKLWLKKKFVVETSWCIRVGCIPEKFYEEIAANEAQRQEWVEFLSIDEQQGPQGDLARPSYSEPLTTEFLAARPALVVDTRHFGSDFTQALIGIYSDLDDQVDGLLVHGENLQALTLMGRRFKGTIDSVYIDPPYNTSASEITYKNSYKHSSWLSMLSDRVAGARVLMKSDAILAVAIDDAEYARLLLMLLQEFGEDRYLSTVVVRAKPQGRAMAAGFSQNHDYAVFFSNGNDASVGRLPRDEERLERYSESDDGGIFAWSNFRGTGANSYRVDRAKLFYPVWVDSETGAVEVPSFEWDDSDGAWQATADRPAGWNVVLPIDDDGVERVWTLGWERAQREADTELTAKEVGGRLQVYRKYRPNQEGALPGTWWAHPKYSSSESGTKVLQNILGSNGFFSYPKSIFTVEDSIRSTGVGAGGFILDHFAGSGTTGHAAINLNREDGGHRKFILVEMGDYFDTVLLPRLKKVTFSPVWKDGRPQRLTTIEEAESSPRIMKVVRLESYEDTLNNLDVSRTKAQQSLLDHPDAQGPNRLREQYLLRYMLDVESQGSPALLNIGAFSDPTAYRLTVKRPGSDETREVSVDLLETFNWLIGLKVERLAAPRRFAASVERDDEQRLRLAGNLEHDPDGSHWFRYATGTLPDDRRAVVIWRMLTDDIERDNLVLNEWFSREVLESAEHDLDLVYVNGSSNLENLRSGNDVWTVRMIEADFHRLMFEEADG